MANATTIEISTENANKLHSISEQIEIILQKRTHVSLNDVISIILDVKHIEEAITDMALASEPTWRRTKKEAKE